MNRLIVSVCFAASALAGAQAQESGGTMVMVTQPEPPTLAS